MSETTPAASSPVEVDVFNGQQPTLAEFNEYREKGEVPERFKPTDQNADAEPAATLEKTGESEGESPEPATESDPEPKQEPVTKADKRIKQLLAERYELEQKLAAATKQGEKQDSTPTSQTTRSKPTADDKNQDGTPKFASYEDFVEELADWKAEQRLETAKREYAEQESRKALQGKLDAAKTRYDDAEEVIFPTAESIQNAKIPQAVKEVFGQSDVFIDLCYVVGSDPDELKKFISLAQSNPRAAIGKVFEYERGIREELSKPRDDKGKFTAPEGKKTSAPKPPSPVSGASSRAFDVSDESLSPDEWARQRNAQIARRKA